MNQNDPTKFIIDVYVKPALQWTEIWLNFWIPKTHHTENQIKTADTNVVKPQKPIETPKNIVPTPKPEVVVEKQGIQEKPVSFVAVANSSKIVPATVIEKPYLDYFKLESHNNICFYKKLENQENLDNLLNEYVELVSETSQKIDALKQTYQLPEEVNIFKVFDSFARLLGRAIKQIDQRKAKLVKELESAYDIEETQEIFYVFLKRNIESNLITPIIGAIYHGMKHDEEYRHVYVDCIGFLNQLFIQLGINIVPAENNKPFDFDMYEALPIYEDSNSTPDPKLKECFYDVQQFAYIFDDNEHFIALGQAIAWRYDS